jgi:anhydro-N-acetylmuramic acid kinase
MSSAADTAACSASRSTPAGELAGGQADFAVLHGQTFFHWVDDAGRALGTLQLGNSAAVAERLGLPLICDLRSRDVAAGGQGEPLVSMFDQLLLAGPAASWASGGVERFDADGALAARGTVSEPLLARLKAEPYYRLPPPRSTGRELFNAGYCAPCWPGSIPLPAARTLPPRSPGCWSTCGPRRPGRTA